MIPRIPLPIYGVLLGLFLQGHTAILDGKGSPSSEIARDHVDVAVSRANKYLMSRQAEDGSISDKKNKTAMTALAIMSMAATGNQPIDPTPEGKCMRRAIDYVINPKNQDKNGYFGKDGSRMYGHGIIALMLSEMLGMGLNDKQDKLTRKSCQKPSTSSWPPKSARKNGNTKAAGAMPRMLGTPTFPFPFGNSWLYVPPKILGSKSRPPPLRMQSST